ncbi:MAG: DUF4388 domain-containing protein [Gemmatimonadetes bacterium]|nr:DUF4388 domain-containing protein [Gemmatimonadota bacterium]
MAIEGPLKELGIHDVFQLLDLIRKTGVLRVTSDLLNNEGRVWFEDGAILFAELRSNPHRLGEMLVRAGKITEADLDRARDMQRSGNDSPIGGILVQFGAIKEEELDVQVRFQTEEVIFEMMGWNEGHFSFEEGHDNDPVPGDRMTRIRTEALLMEGARRIDEWSRMERTIPNVGVIPMFTESVDSKEGELDLVPAEWEVLAAIDGVRDLRSVARFLARSEFDVAKTVFGLESAGVLTIATPQPEPEIETADDEPAIAEQLQIAIGVRDFDRARTVGEGAVKTHPHSAELHFLMARVLRAQRDYAGAEEYCRKALRLDSMYTPSHRQLGDLLALQGMYTDAVEWWDRWLNMQEASGDPHPDTPDVRRALAAAQLLHNTLKTNA